MLTRNIRQVQGFLFDDIGSGYVYASTFTGISQSNPKNCWSLSRLELCPVGTEINTNVAATNLFVHFTLSEKHDTEVWGGGTDKYNEAKVLFAGMWGYRPVAVPAASEYEYPGSWPWVHDFAKGIVTVSPELHVSMAANAGPVQRWSWRLYYTLLTIDADDLVFLRSVR